MPLLSRTVFETSVALSACANRTDKTTNVHEASKIGRITKTKIKRVVESFAEDASIICV